MEKTVKEILADHTMLKETRRLYEPLKQLCGQLSYPERSDCWELANDNEGQFGKVKRIYDPTANESLDIWADGTTGHFMPKQINWFQGEMADRSIRDSKRVRKWLQETDEHLRFVLSQSNSYYDSKRMKIKDGGGLGDGFIFIDRDEKEGKLMTLTPHPREFCVRRDWWGRVMIITHEFQMCLCDAADEFGEEKLNDTQKQQLEKTPFAKITVLHGIYRNKGFNPFAAGVKNMTWQHWYINVGAKIEMRRTGSPTLNPIPWSVNRPSHWQYGLGIVGKMLTEIMTANFISRDMQAAGQQAVRPSMLVPAGIAHKLDLNPDGVTGITKEEMVGLKMGELVARLVDSSGYPFGVDQHQRWQDMIKSRMGVALFTALNMAATQGYKNIEHIRGAQAERAVLMAPFLGTLGTDTDSEMDRIYSLECEPGYDGGGVWHGRAPEPPAEVMDAQNGRIDIQYTGPLFQLLKQYYETGNLLNTIMNIRAVMDIDQQAVVNVNTDELMRKILQSGNTPEEIILSAEEVAEIKAIAAQQQEAQMMAKLAAEGSKAVPNLSKKIEADSVLSQLQGAAA